MRKAQKMLAVILAVLLLVSSGVSGITTAFAVEGKSTEAATEQTTEGHKVAQKVEPETALQTRSGSGPETESETKQTETETQTQKETEPETKKPAETESEEPETKKPANEKPSKPAANEPVSDVKAPKESGVSISSPDDLKAFFPDPNFRQAVYDSIEAYGWLAGNPENSPQSIQEILETYRGPISARSKGINSIEGIHYLKLATTDNEDFLIDLRRNNITDLMPLFKLCNTEDYYYGGYLDTAEGRGWMNVRINVLHNPIKCFPNPKLGRKLGYLHVDSTTENDKEVADASTLKYYFLRDRNEVFSGKMRVGFCQFENNSTEAEYIPLSRMTTANITGSRDANGMTVELAGNEYANYENLNRSTALQITVRAISFITFSAQTFSDAPNAEPGDDTFSYGYRLKPSFYVFDHIILKGDAKGAAQIKKIDEVTKEPLKGAVFELRRVSDDSLVAENLVTGTDGLTDPVPNLENGKYYFKEVKAPNGYVLDESKHEILVGYMAGVDGGMKKLDYKSADGSEVKAEAGKNDTYVSYEMGEDVDFYLLDGEGKRIEDAYDSEDGKSQIANVTLNFASLDGSKTSVAKEYKTLTEAETALNQYIRANQITGEVTATINYNTQPYACATAMAGNAPAVDVQIDKTWKGIGTDDTDLPEVNYTLYRTKKSGEEETVGECKVLVAEKEETVTGGKVTIPAGSPKEDYKCTYIDLPKYEKSDDGTYVKNDDGTLYAYKYFVKEKITQEEDGKYEKEGDVGEASDPVEQDDGTELITIPVTNYRKGKVKIQKSDSSQQREDLSGVRFKLEQEVTKDGVTSWDEVETGTTDAKGALEFKWLSWGKYRLTETQTWDGYILLQDPIVFEVKKEEIQDPNDFVYMIPNDYKFSVPRSGGIGSFWFLVSGSLLILIGGLWAYKRRFCIK